MTRTTTVLSMTQRMERIPAPDVRIDIGPIPVVHLTVVGKIWGNQTNDNGDAQGEEWFATDGSGHVELIIVPPEPDAWYIGDLGGEMSIPVWPSGGSDGRYQYLPILGGNGEWYVDVFDIMMTELLDRWLISGWNSNGYVESGGTYVYQQSSVKHLAASKHRVVVFGDRINDDVFPAHTGIDVAVFDSFTGLEIASYSIPTPPDEFDSTDEIDPVSGSCIDIDETRLFFSLHDSFTGDNFISSIDLETGELTKHFDLSVTDGLIFAQDPTWGDHGEDITNGYGIAHDEDSIFLAGGGGFARISMDGTPLWWKAADFLGLDNGFLADQYATCCLSGNGTVFAMRMFNAFADEFTYDGTYLDSPPYPEPMRHAWLAKALQPNLLKVISVTTRVRTLKKVAP